MRFVCDFCHGFIACKDYLGVFQTIWQDPIKRMFMKLARNVKAKIKTNYVMLSGVLPFRLFISRKT